LIPVFRNIVLKIQSIFNGFDPLAFGPPMQFDHPSLHPIFIVGAPRSGSTLLYQLLLKHSKLAYISNLMSLTPNKMVLIARHTNRLHKFNQLKESDLGYLSGLFSPSEAGSIQKKWFESDFSEISSNQIRNTVIAITHAFSGPFLSKNLLNSLRLKQIKRILPEARFIFIRRDPLYNAQSLLLSRKKMFGTINKWWSVQPIGYEETLKSDPFYQVIWQVLEIERTITNFCKKYSPDTINIAYEDLCKNVKKNVGKVSEKFSVELKKNVGFDDIGHMNAIKLPLEDWSKIEYYHKKLTKLHDS